MVVSLSNSALNEKSTMSMIKNALFNEKAQRIEMGTAYSGESRALVSQGSRERG